MRSGCTLADPFVPTRSNQKRSASPMWRQLTSIDSDTPFSHTTSAVAMSSTPSFDGRMACAATRLAAGQPASHRPRSSSWSPRSRNAPPPASWRRSRQPMTWRLGWNVYQPPRIACSRPMSPPARNPRTACTSERNRWFMPTITPPLALFLARLRPPLDACQGERERALAQHMHARRERRDDMDLVQVVGRADRHRVRAGVLEHLFDVVERLLDFEPRGEGLRLAEIVVADRRHLDAGEPPQRRQMGDLRDRSRANDGDADRVAHFVAQRYMTPERSDAVESPLESTPRASSVKRHRLAPNSAPSVPFNPAVISCRASCTKVPLMAAPLPWRKWAPRPIPM